MRYLLTLLFGLIIAGASSCSNGSDATDAELKLTREAARRHATEALSFPENNMEREKAILAIRARETRLRDAGFEACADAYINEAAETLGLQP